MTTAERTLRRFPPKDDNSINALLSDGDTHDSTHTATLLRYRARLFVALPRGGYPLTKDLCNAAFDKYYATKDHGKSHVATYKTLAQCVDKRVLTREASLGNRFLRAELNRRLLDAGIDAIPIPMSSRPDCCHIGMSAAEVRASKWGSPRAVNTTVTALVRHEQWVYEKGYLYFDNGILTAIQTSE
ncbi:MAG TPA: hypothetical protein VHC20_01535 [Candidatus Paceibacterota bacterium]|nr:hypothetical protein [Candidatus Paceibacterota bacterium]